MAHIIKKPFGKISEDVPVALYTFTNAAGCEVSVCSYGGSIVSIKVPDRNGNFADIVLGYEDLQGYVSHRCFFGASIGRCCNRIGRGLFTLNGIKYQLNCNEGRNHLHGGIKGFDVKVWDCAVVQNNLDDTLVLHLTSPDGDECYPGNLDVTMTYSFTDRNEMIMHYEAVCDADTVCNLTNHSYFNLAGHDSGNILGQQLKIYADYFTEADSEGISTGNILNVEGTPMDFRKFHTVGERINADCVYLKYGGGYDQNWILNKSNKRLEPCAEMYDEKSGRHMTCITTSPCVQFYSGNFIEEDQKGKNGFAYQKRAGFCLETQFAPDAVNHPEWASPVLKAGEHYDETTIYRFDIK